MSRTIVILNDADTRIGYSTSQQRWFNTVKDAEWRTAKERLLNTPQGIEVSFTEDDDLTSFPINGRSVSLTHIFIVKSKRVRQEVEITTVVAISRDKQRLIKKEDQDQDGIEPSEWEIAEQELAGKPRMTKLNPCRQYWQTNEVRHPFIIINGVEFAMSGPGWEKYGGMAKVVAAVNQNESNRYFAIKFPFPWLHQFNYKAIVGEIGISITAGFLVAWSDRPASLPNARHHYALVFPYYPASLSDFCCQQRTQTHSKTDARKIIAQLLKALLFASLSLSGLHQRGILHRDIKQENILLNFDLNTNEITEARLADFGYSVQRPLDDIFFREGYVVGTDGFHAPEILNTQTYSVKSDIFAFAIMMRETFSSINTLEQYLSPLFAILVDMMTHPQPSRRLILPYIQIALTVLLHRTLLESREIYPHLLRTFNCPVTTAEGAEFIVALINQYHASHADELSNDAWIKRVVHLEQNLPGPNFFNDVTKYLERNSSADIYTSYSGFLSRYRQSSLPDDQNTFVLNTKKGTDFLNQLTTILAPQELQSENWNSFVFALEQASLTANNPKHEMALFLLNDSRIFAERDTLFIKLSLIWKIFNTITSLNLFEFFIKNGRIHLLEDELIRDINYYLRLHQTLIQLQTARTESAIAGQPTLFGTNIPQYRNEIRKYEKNLSAELNPSTTCCAVA